MPPATPSSQLRPNLRRSYIDAVAFSVMVGAGETYLAAFALALGMGELIAGLIASIPMLAGAILQLISPMMVRRLGSNRRWVVLCAMAQASSFLPLAAAALAGKINVTALFAVAALYWGAGMATGAAWNTWISTLIPRRIRANYFARRSRGAHFAVLCGLVLGGLALHYGASRGQLLIAFALLFLLSAACRFISAILLSGQSEPVLPDESHREVPVRELVGRFRHGHDGRLLLYMLAVQVAVQISGPFFTPFMLGQLKMSYVNYLLLIATSYSARIAMLPTFGALVRRVGARRVLWFSGLSIIPLSAMWLVSDSLVYLFVVQLIAGAVWAAYELTTFLLLFETIPEHERTSVLTTFNLANAVAMVGGSAVGGWLLTALGTDHGAYMVIFAISGIVRVFTVVLLGRAARVVPDTIDVNQTAVSTRVVAVRPNLGSIERPVLPALPQTRTPERAA